MANENRNPPISVEKVVAGQTYRVILSTDDGYAEVVGRVVSLKEHPSSTAHDRWMILRFPHGVVLAGGKELLIYEE